MEDKIITLIREYPWGAFFLVLALLTTIERVVKMVINRERPQIVCPRGHFCDSCEDEEDDE